MSAATVHSQPLPAYAATGEQVRVPVHADPREFARFYAGVAIVPVPHGCHLWTREILKGYGRFVTREYTCGLLAPRLVVTVAHSYSYAAHHGPLPKVHARRNCYEPVCTDAAHYRTLGVRHTCDETLCVNPAHLLRGDAWDNAHDRGTRGRTASRRHGIRRHSADTRDFHARARRLRDAVRDTVAAGRGHLLPAVVAAVKAEGDPRAGQLALFPTPAAAPAGVPRLRRV